MKYMDNDFTSDSFIDQNFSDYPIKEKQQKRNNTIRSKRLQMEANNKRRKNIARKTLKKFRKNVELKNDKLKHNNKIKKASGKKIFPPNPSMNLLKLKKILN